MGSSLSEARQPRSERRRLFRERGNSATNGVVSSGNAATPQRTASSLPGTRQLRDERRRLSQERGNSARNGVVSPRNAAAPQGTASSLPGTRQLRDGRGSSSTDASSLPGTGQLRDERRRLFQERGSSATNGVVSSRNAAAPRRTASSLSGTRQLRDGQRRLFQERGSSARNGAISPRNAPEHEEGRTASENDSASRQSVRLRVPFGGRGRDLRPPNRAAHDGSRDDRSGDARRAGSCAGRPHPRECR